MSASIEQRVKGIIVKQLGIEEGQIAPTSSFIEDLGADSLDVMELVMAMEDTFGVQIPEDKAAELRTVQDAVRFVAANA